MKIYSVAVLALVSAMSAPVNADSKFSTGGSGTMSEIAFKKYLGFEKKWPLVTARFRKDTGEMRLVYANKLAWNVLQKNGKDYPDGAVFAKIGLATEPDPAFTSSATPSGARRYQFMVRDKKKYASTGGWGYALFDAKGVTFPERPDTQAAACYACHRIVPERGEVFAKPMALSIHDQFRPLPSQEGKIENRVAFETKPIASLPESVSKQLPSNAKEVRVVVGSLAENLFQGTLDEIRPALAAEVERTHLPAILMNKSGDRYSIIFESVDETSCVAPSGKGQPMTAIGSMISGGAPTLKFGFCHQADPRRGE